MHAFSLNRRSMLKTAIATILATGIGTPFAWADEPIATTKHGKVRGKIENGINVFKGVRYGADTATTRFQAPRAPEAWSGVIDALDYGNQTPQPGAGDGGGVRLIRHIGGGAVDDAHVGQAQARQSLLEKRGALAARLEQSERTFVFDDGEGDPGVPGTGANVDHRAWRQAAKALETVAVVIVGSVGVIGDRR